MKTKKLLLCLGLLCFNGISFSQGLEGIVVEKYYLTNAADGSNGSATGAIANDSPASGAAADLILTYGAHRVKSVETR